MFNKFKVTYSLTNLIIYSLYFIKISLMIKIIMLEYIRYFKSSVYLINLEINPLYELITEFTTRWHSCKKNTILFNTYIKIV